MINKIPLPADAHERAERIYAEGKMDKDVAEHFKVSRQIIYLWRSRDKAFDEACERGKSAGEAIRAEVIFQTQSERRGEHPGGWKQPPSDAAQTIEKLCAFGHTDFEIAGFFTISLGTLVAWKARHPEIGTAFKVGKEVADDRVERSLYSRATGYSHEAVKIFNDKGAVTKVDYIEHMPPDTGACIFWLKNRRQELWKDRREVTAAGADGKNLNDLSSNELDRQVVEALRRAQEVTRRVDAAARAAASTATSNDEPDRVH